MCRYTIADCFCVFFIIYILREQRKSILQILKLACIAPCLQKGMLNALYSQKEFENFLLRSGRKYVFFVILSDFYLPLMVVLTNT